MNIIRFYKTQQNKTVSLKMVQKHYQKIAYIHLVWMGEKLSQTTHH